MHSTEPTTAALPVWSALPPAGQRCAISGMKRGRLLALIKSGEVKSAHLREGNAKRGTRLLNVESLLAFLESKSVEVEA